MSLPNKPARSRNGRFLDPKSRGANKPDIFIKTGKDGYFGNVYAKAHIRVRGGRYRYLVWRERGQIREFYLGKALTPCPTAQLACSSRQVAGAGNARRARKGGKR
jgi:hypothetical protein